MTLSSRHRIRNSSPGGLRPSTLPLGHGGSPQYCLTFLKDCSREKDYEFCCCWMLLKVLEMSLAEVWRWQKIKKRSLISVIFWGIHSLQCLFPSPTVIEHPLKQLKPFSQKNIRNQTKRYGKHSSSIIAPFIDGGIIMWSVERSVLKSWRQYTPGTR